MIEDAFPLEIFCLIGHHIHDRETFHAFAICFPAVAKLLKQEKQPEFEELDRRRLLEKLRRYHQEGYGLSGPKVNMTTPLQELKFLAARIEAQKDE